MVGKSREGMLLQKQINKTSCQFPLAIAAWNFHYDMWTIFLQARIRESWLTVECLTSILEVEK